MTYFFTNLLIYLSLLTYHFWIVSRLLLKGAPLPESCCSRFHLFSSWSSTRYWSSFNWLGGSCGQSGGILNVKEKTLKQCKNVKNAPQHKGEILTCLIMSRCLLASVEVCSFRLLNWNTMDLRTLLGKVYYVMPSCFVNFLRIIRTNYGPNILFPKCSSSE